MGQQFFFCTNPYLNSHLKARLLKYLYIGKIIIFLHHKNIFSLLTILTIYCLLSKSELQATPGWYSQNISCCSDDIEDLNFTLFSQSWFRVKLKLGPILANSYLFYHYTRSFRCERFGNKVWQNSVVNLIKKSCHSIFSFWIDFKTPKSRGNSTCKKFQLNLLKIKVKSNGSVASSSLTMQATRF